MKIETKRSDLLHALIAADGIARPSTSPILECAMLSALDDKTLTVAATDLTLTICATIPSDNSRPGSVATPAKRLREIIKGAPSDAISLTVIDNNWIEIKSGRAKYKLASVPGRDFPKVPGAAGNGKTATFDGDVLKRLIDRVLYSTSDDITRNHLCAALFKIEGGVASMTSTDGHRLSRATCACDAPDVTALIPSEALAKIARIADWDVEITVERARIFASAGNLTLSSPLVDAQFPPYEQVIPKHGKHTITVNREALIASVERTRFATSETRGMQISADDGSLVFSSNHPDVGEMSDELAAKGASNDLRSGCAPKYLIEALSRFADEDVAIKMSGELDPILIEGTTSKDYQAVIMPMRVDP